MSTGHIEKEWADFARMIPPNAPEIQNREMRQAFFAGAAMMFTTIAETSEMKEEDAV